jgi:hypothetical protein
MSASIQNGVIPFLNTDLSTYSSQKMTIGSKIHIVWINGISDDGTKIFICPFDFNNKALVTNARRMLEGQVIATVRFVNGKHVLFQASVPFAEEVADEEATLFYKNGSVETKIAELSVCASFNEKEYDDAMSIFKSWYTQAQAKFFPA